MNSQLGQLFSLKSLLVLMLSLTALCPREAKADPMRDFIVSCSYGVLAGTLVGAATLAFSDKPGENLNKVARGASLGLYAGILLGAYVVYGGPGEDDDAAALINRASNDRPRASTREALTFGYRPVERARMLAKSSPLQVYPLLGDRGIEGAAARVRLLTF